MGNKQYEMPSAQQKQYKRYVKNYNKLKKEGQSNVSGLLDPEKDVKPCLLRSATCTYKDENEKDQTLDLDNEESIGAYIAFLNNSIRGKLNTSYAEQYFLDELDEFIDKYKEKIKKYNLSSDFLTEKDIKDCIKSLGANCYYNDYKKDENKFMLDYVNKYRLEKDDKITDEEITEAQKHIPSKYDYIKEPDAFKPIREKLEKLIKKQINFVKCQQERKKRLLSYMHTNLKIGPNDWKVIEPLLKSKQMNVNEMNKLTQVHIGKKEGTFTDRKKEAVLHPGIISYGEFFALLFKKKHAQILANTATDIAHRRTSLADSCENIYENFMKDEKDDINLPITKNDEDKIKKYRERNPGSLPPYRGKLS